MDRPTPDFATALKALLAHRRSLGLSHPDTGELIGLVDRRLPLAAADAVREHLSMCPECCRRALRFASGGASGDRDSEDKGDDPVGFGGI
jgi:anti-sigma factor RsiW